MKTRKNSAMNIVLVAIVDETDIGFPAAHFLDYYSWDTCVEKVRRTTCTKGMAREELGVKIQKFD